MRKRWAYATLASLGAVLVLSGETAFLTVAVLPLGVAPLMLIPGGMGWAFQGLDALASAWPAGWLALGLAGSACAIACGMACVDRVDRR